MFSKVGPGQPENLSSDLGCCGEGNRVQSVRFCLSFRVYFSLYTGQITAVNPADPGGGQGLETSIRHDRMMRQPWGSAFPQIRSAMVLMVRKSKEGMQVPRSEMLRSPLFSSC